MPDQLNDFLSVEEIIERIHNRVSHVIDAAPTPLGKGATYVETEAPQRPLRKLTELRRNLRTANSLLKELGTIRERPPGLKNATIQLVQKCIRQLLNWLLRPLRQLNASVLASLGESAHALENLQTELTSIARRLEALEASLLPEPSVGIQQSVDLEQSTTPHADHLPPHLLAQIDLFRSQLEALSSDVRKVLANHDVHR